MYNGVVVAIRFKDAMKYYTHPNETVLMDETRVGEMNVALDFLSDASRGLVVTG